MVDAANDEAVRAPARPQAPRGEAACALMYPDLDAVLRHARRVAPRKRACSPRRRRPSCCVDARDEAGLAVGAVGGARQPSTRRDAAVHAAASSAHARPAAPVVATSGNLRGRADLHRRGRGRRAARRHRRPVPRARPADRPPRGRLRRPASCSAASWCCGARAAMRRCRCRSPTTRRRCSRVGAHLKNTVAVAAGSPRLHQPAHRRPGNDAIDRRVPRSAVEPGAAVSRDAVGGGRRPAPRLPSTHVRASVSGVPVTAVQHHLRAPGRVHGRERR